MMCSAWPWGRGREIAARGCAVALALAAAARPALAQETCPTATPVTVGQTFMGNNASAAADPVVGFCAASGHDVWHSFVPSATGVYTVSLCGSSFDTVAGVYLSCFDEPLDCNDDACGDQSVMAVALTAGQAYVVRVGAAAGGPGGTYRLTITPPAGGVPGNNICGGGTVLPPNQTVIASNAGATGSDANGACGGADDRADVWYSFNPAASGTHIVELCSTAFDAVLSVHSSCFNANILACGDDDAVTGCPAGAGARAVFSASMGTPVLIRVAGAGGSFGAYSLVIHTAASNDACASAQPVVRGNPALGSVTPALSTDLAAPCAASAHDLWYGYVATLTGPHTFGLCDSPTNTVLSLHTGCPGSPGAAAVACSDDGCTSGIGGASEASRLTAVLQAGQLYLVRIAGRVTGGQTATGPFTLVVDVSTPANDACAAAAALTPGVPVESSTYGATGGGADPTPGCGEGDTDDVWFTFTPAQAGMYEFNTCGSAMNTTLALFSGCGAAPLACSDDDPGFCGAGFGTGARVAAVLNAGTAYLVRVAGVNGAQGPFRLAVNRTPGAGDTCAAAVAVPQGVTVAATLTGTLSSGVPFCGGLDTPDVYFAFTPAQSRHYRFSTCGSTARVVLGLFTDCPPGSGAVCADEPDEDCGPGTSTALTAVLRAGVTYRLRVAAAPGESGGNLRLRVDPVSPPNDECVKSQALAVNQFVPASNVGASGQDVSACGIADTRDVFFAFNAELGGVYEFLTCAGFGGVVDTTLALFDGCDGSMLGCNDDAGPGGPCDGLTPALSRLAVRLEAGQNVLLRASVAGGGEAAFGIGVRNPRPANDTCAAAASVADGLTTFDTLGASTETATMSGCGLGFTQIANDLWFRYVATFSGPAVVSTCGSGFDTALAVLDGEQGCAGGLSVLACDDDFDCDQRPVTPDRQSRTAFVAELGRGYLIRVGSLSGERGPGELRITRPGAPACRCDWNGTGGLTVQDVFDFLGAWFAGAGDFDASGRSDLEDLFGFLTCYLTNPPECR